MCSFSIPKSTTTITITTITNITTITTTTTSIITTTTSIITSILYYSFSFHQSHNPVLPYMVHSNVHSSILDSTTTSEI